MNDGTLPRGPLIWLGRILILAAFFALWEYAADRRWIDPILIGAPSGIARFLWEGIFINGTLIDDLGWTMLGTLLAFVLGSAAGIAFAAGAQSRKCKRRIAQPPFAPRRFSFARFRATMPQRRFPPGGGKEHVPHKEQQ